MRIHIILARLHYRDTLELIMPSTRLAFLVAGLRRAIIGGDGVDEDDEGAGDRANPAHHSPYLLLSLVSQEVSEGEEGVHDQREDKCEQRVRMEEQCYHRDDKRRVDLLFNEFEELGELIPGHLLLQNARGDRPTRFARFSSPAT